MYFEFHIEQVVKMTVRIQGDVPILDRNTEVVDLILQKGVLRRVSIFK